MRIAIEHTANERGVSLNTEIVDRLDRSFGKEFFEELLRMAYRPAVSPPLIEVYRRGMLRITSSQKEYMLERLGTFLDGIMGD